MAGIGFSTKFRYWVIVCNSDETIEYHSFNCDYLKVFKFASKLLEVNPINLIDEIQILVGHYSLEDIKQGAFKGSDIICTLSNNPYRDSGVYKSFELKRVTSKKILVK